MMFIGGDWNNQGFTAWKRSNPVTTTPLPSTTTRRITTTSSDEGKVVLITGGANKYDHEATVNSAEIFVPNSPNNPCLLPNLPAAYDKHTQSGGMICGGWNSIFYKGKDNWGTRFCHQWNSEEGKWYDKPVHEFNPGRYALVSWSPASEKETFLIGNGGRADKLAMNTSTKVKPGIYEGTHGFKLKYPFGGGCSVPDPETDTLVITGGWASLTLTSLYNENGFVEYFGNLTHKRAKHGCSSYFDDNKRVFFLK